MLLKYGEFLDNPACSIAPGRFLKSMSAILILVEVVSFQASMVHGARMSLSKLVVGPEVCITLLNLEFPLVSEEHLEEFSCIGPQISNRLVLVAGKFGSGEVIVRSSRYQHIECSFSDYELLHEALLAVLELTA